jgi:sulfite exporter TauE/SafE/copper chaperone CopZ
MENSKNEKIELKINGMHCASCELYVERQFLMVPGVNKVDVSSVSGKATLVCDCQPDINELQKSISDQGYTIEDLKSPSNKLVNNKSIGVAVFLIAIAAYLLLRQFNFMQAGFGIEENIGLLAVLGIGLLASISTCMAVTGGLLVAMSAKYSQAHPELSARQKLKPLLYFNFGRLVGYAVFGGLVGVLGAVLTLSSLVNGLITILASIIMLILGAQLLGIIPAGLIRTPKVLSKKIYALSDSNNRFAPAILGALTFFLPCGFTQALQLYVLAQGGALLGMLVMGTFAIGTLPALLLVGFLTSFANGAMGRYVAYLAGALAVIASLIMLPSGFSLIGSAVSFGGKEVKADMNDSNVKIVNGVQVVNMKVDFIDYLPYQFTVQAGMPVEWNVDGTKAAGCMTSLIVPKLGIREYLPATGSRKITFTPTTPGVYEFSCAMGMGTPGAAIIVVDPKS